MKTTDEQFARCAVNIQTKCKQRNCILSSSTYCVVEFETFLFSSFGIKYFDFVVFRPDDPFVSVSKFFLVKSFHRNSNLHSSSIRRHFELNWVQFTEISRQNASTIAADRFSTSLSFAFTLLQLSKHLGYSTILYSSNAYPDLVGKSWISRSQSGAQAETTINYLESWRCKATSDRKWRENDAHSGVKKELSLGK